jgi:hypothetical protein
MKDIRLITYTQPSKQQRFKAACALLESVRKVHTGLQSFRIHPAEAALSAGSGF